MLVEDGRLPMQAAHLQRMSASAEELYGLRVTFPERSLRPRHSGRVRVTFVPGRGVEAEAGPLGPDPLYQQVAPFVLPGGLGCHKWADRRLVDALAEAAAGALPLLIDADGSVLEATWASVLIEERGRLIAPPADDRALPGIGRMRLRYDEEPVDLDRLLAADAVVLTSALRVVRLVQ